ncbi:MAG: DUF2799 domain-containing protein [Rhodoferax sp.]|nr:DUF2799 domain-containing protein [Rhodoferax sp.]
MTPEECNTANWSQRGEQDGTAGRGDRSAAYAESCAKVGITPDADAYRAARSRGLQSYCRLDVALSEGLAGKRYGDVCPAPIGVHFKMFHQAAYNQYEARNTLTRLEREQDTMQTELRNSKTTDERKKALREDLTQSDRRLADARSDLRAAETRLDRMGRELRQNGLY